MANILKIKRGTAATIPQGQLAEPLFTTDTYDLYIGKGSGGNQRIQKYITSGTSSQFLKGDGSLDSNTYEPSITAGTTLQYWRGDKSWQTLDTNVVPENGPIYFTEPRVLATVLTGLNLSGGGTIAATDSILTAFGKVQNQISALVGGATYQGVWNASTNSPTLASGTGTKGYYYVVSVAGSTNLDGITDWKVGDWAIFNGTTWDKVDNTDAVSSVNGFTGAVNLGLGDISNVTLTSPTNNQLIKFDGGTSKWVNFTPAYEPTLTKGNLTESTSSVLTITGGTGAVIGSGTTIQVKLASSTQSGYLSSTDWTTFNNKQNAITLTTTGTSGAATFVSSTLNIPNYSLSGLGGVPTSRTLTINGTGYDLSADRTWSVGTVTSIALATGTSGTDVNVSGSPVTGSGTITLNIPDASATARGLITTGTQTIGGNKTFSKSILVGGGSDGEYALTLGEGRSGNGYSYVDLVGDATYTDYGLRLIRSNGGANTDSSLIHRGTGSLVIETTEGGAIKFRNSAGTDAATISSGNLTLNNGGDLVISAATSGSNTTLNNDTGTLLISTPSQITGNLTLASGGDLIITPATSGVNATLYNDIGKLISSASISVQGTGEFTSNVAVGTTNSQAIIKTLDINSAGNGLASNTTSQIIVSGNAYYGSGGWTYGSTAAASYYEQNNGIHRWYTAPSGTAGNTITWTNVLTIANNGTSTFTGDVNIRSINAKTSTSSRNINVIDTTAMAANVGGGISFQGFYTTGGAIGNFGAIDAYKTNATSGNESGGLRFYYSANGILTQGLQISETGAATFSNNVTIGSSLTNGYIYGPSGQIFGSVGSNTTWINSGTSGLRFNNAADNQTRMFMSDAGLVGIGTASPGSIFEVKNAGTGGSFSIAAAFRDSSTNGNALEIYNKNGESRIMATYYSTGSNQDLTFWTTLSTGQQYERMRITSGGNVGINTASPTFAAGGGLQVVGSGFTSVRVSAGSNTGLDISQTNTTGDSYVYLRDNAPLIFGTNNTERMRITSGGNMLLGSSTDYGGLLQVNGQLSVIKSSGYGYLWYSNNTANNQYLFHQIPSADVFLIATGKNGTSNQPALAFGTADTERIRITSTGKTWLSSTDNSYGQYQIGNSTSGGEASMAFISGVTAFGTTPTSTNGDAYIWAIGANVYSIGGNSWGIANKGKGGVNVYLNGNTATSWTAGTSDIRLKKNFEPVQGLTELMQINPVKYHFEWDDDNDPKRLGFTAQNLLTLIPEMVSKNGQKAEDGSDYLTITPDYILPVLVKSIQELKAELDTLKNKN